MTKTCAGPCGKTLPAASYAADKQRRDGLHPYCRPCRNLMQRRASKRKALGTSPWTDAAPIRAHIEQLLIRGMSRHQIGELAGLHRTIIRNLVIGQPHANQPPASRIRRDNAAKLLAVGFTPCAPVPNTTTRNRQAGVTIDNTGTRRRLEALMANGWSARELSRRLGHHGHALQLPKYRRCTSNTATAVAQLYAELESTPGPSQPMRTYYRGRGYLPPGWWDPDTIDDPDATPAGLTYQPLGDGPAIDVDMHRDDQVAILTRAGLTPTQIASQLGCSRKTIVRAVTRNTTERPGKRIRRSAA